MSYTYYKEARAFDTRFKYFDFLNHTFIELEELKNIEADQKKSKTKNQLVEKYIQHFKDYRDDLSKKEETRGKTNPSLWIGLITILSPFISQLMAEIGKYLIGIFKNM